MAMCCDVFVFTCILNPLVVYCLLNLCLATRVRSFQAANPSSFSPFFVVGCAHIAMSYVWSYRTAYVTSSKTQHSQFVNSSAIKWRCFCDKMFHLFPSCLEKWKFMANKTIWFEQICLQFCINQLPLLHAWYDRN